MITVTLRFSFSFIYVSFFDSLMGQDTAIEGVSHLRMTGMNDQILRVSERI